MDFAEVIQNLNWLAVIAAAISTFLIGGFWYSPVFLGKQWLKVNGVTEEELNKRNMVPVFVLSFILSLIMSFNLAMFIGKEGVAFAAIAGFFTGFGWVLPAIAIISLFENRSLAYILINGGYMVISFIVMGIIIGMWK